MGVALVSDRAAHEPARWGMISIVKPDGAELSREFFAVYASDRPLSLAAEQFLKAACGA
jgi:DNA-binding transcriptional LysR family regulator